jgi:hypothetical protein
MIAARLGGMAMVDAIHIHDDGRELRNLYPLAAADEAAADLQASREASERNRAPSGLGWTAIHIIRFPTISYVDAGLRLADAAAALAAIMPRVEVYNEPDAWCFGLGWQCFIKLEPTGGLVKRIWFDLKSNDRARVAALRAAIEAIDGLCPSILVDYPWKVEGPISDRAFLDAYFAAHAAN